MNQSDWKQKLIPHLTAAAVFLVIALFYFYPVLQGKQLKQHDILQWEGMSHEIQQYREEKGKEPLWTNSMFGGMPAFQISVLYPSNLVRFADKIFQLGLPSPINLFFILMAGFYFLLVTLKLDYRLGIAGAIAFGLSSYFLIVIEAGHNSKVHAAAYMAPVLAGMIMTFRGRLLFGGALTALFLSLQLYANHLQITYYLLLTIVLLGATELVKAVTEKSIPQFAKACAILVASALLAVGPNITNLLCTYEYGKYTTRGPSELTAKKSSDGLDKDYALSWSYGQRESATLLIPNFMGGPSASELTTGSAAYKAMTGNGVAQQQAKQIIKNIPTYWGEQPSTSGPVYAGAVVCFLFVLAMFVLNSPYKWWLFAATVMSITFSWGRFFYPLTDLLFEYLPGFNKFRSVSMTLVVAELTIPLLAVWGLHKLFEEGTKIKNWKKHLQFSLAITGGFALLFVLFPGIAGTFHSPSDPEYSKAGFPPWLIDAIITDRESLLRMDALRSFVFVLLSSGLIWVTQSGKLKKNYAYLAFALLFLTDLGLVDKRYIHKDSFEKSSQANKPQPTEVNQAILQDPDPNFRVMNLTVSTFNDATTSYFHKSIGGYHGAKLKRFQELNEYQISRNNISVLSMLNAKYFIVPGENGSPMVQQNPGALGNAWFVNEIKIVENADSEITALTGFNPAQTVIVDKRFSEQLKGFTAKTDSFAYIRLTKYEPNYLVYESEASSEQLAVFSEIYYDKGWDAYIDEKPAPYFRANYVLRAMRIPAGKHKIEFKFEPKTYYTGERIALVSSLLLFVLIGAAIYREGRKNKSGS